MKPDTHSPDHARLGRAVRELRARRGLSQEELGFRAGLHRNYVGAIERGEINPTFRVLLKLERGLQLPLSEIIQLWERRATDAVAPRLRRPPAAPAHAAPQTARVTDFRALPPGMSCKRRTRPRWRRTR